LRLSLHQQENNAMIVYQDGADFQDFFDWSRSRPTSAAFSRLSN
jgi:hypothetical protein